MKGNAPVKLSCPVLQVAMTKPFVAVSILLLMSGSRVFANPWKEMLGHLPAEANAIALIDLEHLRNESLSRPELAATMAIINESIPPSIRRMATAASINLDTLDSDWEVSVGNITRARTLEQMAVFLGGYVDQIDAQPVVWYPRGYVRMLDPAHVGVLRPAQRRMMSKWLHKEDGRSVTPALAETLELPHDRETLYLAIDLTQAISSRAVRSKLASSNLPGIEPRDFDLVADVLSSVRLVSLSVDIDRTLRGRLMVSFAQDPKLPAAVWKDLLLEILRRRGAYLQDVPNWNARLQEQSLVLSGSMSPEGLEDVLSFLTGPNVLGQQQAATSESAETSSLPTSSPSATQGYFRSVKTIVSRIRDRSAKTQGERAMWNDKYSRKIDELPILNVDPLMIDYGAKVASLLRGSGRAIRDANLSLGASRSRPAIDYDGIYAVNDNAPYDAELQAQARAKGTGAYLDNLKEIDSLTAEIRRAMTEKYKIEF
jgi:hypothetical protein